MQDKLRDLYAERLGIDNYEGGALIGARKKRRAPAKGKKAVINALVKAMTSKRKARGRGYVGGEDYEDDYMGSALIGARRRRVGRPKKARKYKGRGVDDIINSLIGGSSKGEIMNILANLPNDVILQAQKEVLKLNPPLSYLNEVKFLKDYNDLDVKAGESALRAYRNIKYMLENADDINITPTSISDYEYKKKHNLKSSLKKKEVNKKMFSEMFPDVPQSLLPLIEKIVDKTIETKAPTFFLTS